MIQKFIHALRSSFILFFLVFALVYAAPIPDLSVALNLTKVSVVRGNGTVAIVGNSVIGHVSACDADRRKLPEYLGSDLHSNVTNLAVPGQSTGAGLDYLTYALRRKGTSGGVDFVASTLSTETYWDLQTQLFFDLTASPDYEANSIRDRMRVGGSVISAYDEPSRAFVYRGRQIPDYNGIKLHYFEPEKQAQSCPETLGQNRSVIEALYWGYFVMPPLRQQNIAGLVHMQQIANSLHKPVLFVMMPIDIEDIESMDKNLADAVRARNRSTIHLLRDSKLNILDLTETLSADEFSDRWCACGHSNAKGLTIIADRTAAAYKLLMENQNSNSLSGER